MDYGIDKNMTEIPAVSGVKQGLTGLNQSVIEKIPFHDWPYWKELGIGLGIVVILWIIYWFWYNFWR